MRLRIPRRIIERWAEDLKRAGFREIGGVLFGEQISEGDFRIVETTRQKLWGGTTTTFKRRGRAARKEILALHDKFSGSPERFNYLGEWHSHPNAPTWPSLQDETTMYNLIADQGEAVNFLVLLIMKLDQRERLNISAQTYLASGHTLGCEIEIEGSTSEVVIKRLNDDGESR